MRNDLRFPRLWQAGGWLLVTAVVITCLLPSSSILPVARFLPDKAEHALAFFGMTMWFCGIYPQHRWQLIAGAFLLLGMAIELAQGALTSTRSMDVVDVIADAVGIAIALLLVRMGLRDWSVRVEQLLPAPRG